MIQMALVISHTLLGQQLQENASWERKGWIVGGGHRQHTPAFIDNEISSPTVALTSLTSPSMTPPLLSFSCPLRLLLTYTSAQLIYSSTRHFLNFNLSIFFASLLHTDSLHGSIRMALPHSRSLNKTAMLKFVSCSQTVNLRRRGQSCGQ